MKGTAYWFAQEVDRQIEELTRNDYLMRIGRGKLLHEELYPISRLALHLKQPGLGIEVEAFEDDGPVDGHIWESGFRKREFDIEVTSDYSYDESLRDELFAAEGIAWGAGEIYRDKNSRKVVATCGVVDGDAHLTDVSKAVVRLFRNKASKSYPPNTVLIISFGEIRLFGLITGIKCCRALATKAACLAATFRRSISAISIQMNCTEPPNKSFGRERGFGTEPRAVATGCYHSTLTSHFVLDLITRGHCLTSVCSSTHELECVIRSLPLPVL